MKKSAVKSEKVKKSEVIFGSLIFLNFRYVKRGILGDNNIGIKKCRKIFLWVQNFGEVGIFFPKLKTCLASGILEFLIQKCGFHMKILSQILTFSKLLFGFIFKGISLIKSAKASKRA